MSQRGHTADQSSYRLAGRIYFNNGRKSLPCFIRDIFYEGARIILSQRVELPNVIELHVPQKHRVVRATVRWSHGNVLGLVFLDLHQRLPTRLRL
jgi:hypothetical protein